MAKLEQEWDCRGDHIVAKRGDTVRLKRCRELLGDGPGRCCRPVEHDESTACPHFPSNAAILCGSESPVLVDPDDGEEFRVACGLLHLHQARCEAALGNVVHTWVRLYV